MMARGLLLLTGVATLLASIALSIETTPAFTRGFTINPTSCQIPLISGLALYNVLLTIGLVASGLISLYWLTRPTSGTNRLILLVAFGIAILCGVSQFRQGVRRCVLRRLLGRCGLPRHGWSCLRMRRRRPRQRQATRSRRT